MTEAKIHMSDAKIAAAIERSRNEPDEPHATSIDYAQNLHLLVVHLSNGLRLALPIENLQGLEKATPEQLRKYELHGLGYGFGFPDLHADFYLPTLMEGVYGTKRWMAQLGKLHGTAKAKAKQQATSTKRASPKRAKLLA